ncbi:hypothetical protein V6R86_09230 [Sphingomonas kaistensis]|uniref:Uncharacterized protein n=1 Tax=Sphingomonas kaistensis TaxID=298708 RepID=A0ABZ2G187_9SPHN
MGREELRTSLDAALTKAFAARNERVRMAYIDLADFYERQLRKNYGAGSGSVFLR